MSNSTVFKQRFKMLRSLADLRIGLYDNGFQTEYAAVRIWPLLPAVLRV